MFKWLEILHKLAVIIGIVVLSWALWPVLTALVAVLNGLAHLFHH